MDFPARPGRRADRACGSRARGSGQDAGVQARPALGRSRDSPRALRHLAAGTPGAGRGPCGPPAPARRPAPAAPKWLREPAEPPGSVLGSTPSRPRLPSLFTQNVPSICPLPGIFLLGAGPARLKSSAPDPLLGRSSRNPGLACHGLDQLLSSPA